MWRVYLSILIALSLVLLHAPVGGCQELRATLQPLSGAETSRNRADVKQQSARDQARPQSSSPLDQHVEKIKRTVRKIGMVSKITVYLNNGDELHGDVTQIDEESFQVAEVDLHQVFTIQYKNVKKVRSGYGGINLFTGKRMSPPRGVRIGALVGGLVLALGLPLIILATTKD